jgi:hypothetical protein
MEVWSRLRIEPTRLRAAVQAQSRARMQAVVRRLAQALAILDVEARTANGKPILPLTTGRDSQRYQRPAELAAEYGVHPKTLQRWLADDLPEALLKRRRLTLVDMKCYAEWKARYGKRHAG